MLTCWPKNENPEGFGSSVVVVTIVTCPAFGVVTSASTGWLESAGGELTVPFGAAVSLVTDVVLLFVNTAVTLLAASIGTSHVLVVPEQSPPHSAKVDPVVGVAVR